MFRARFIRVSGLAIVIAMAVPLHASDSIGLDYSGNVSWDVDSGVVIFQSTGAMPDGKETFYWDVPAQVRKIVIAEDVTVTGGFRVGYRPSDNPLEIEGRSRETSVLFGTDAAAWAQTNNVPESDKWRYGAVNVLADAVVHVRRLTSRNPRSYHISGYANESVIHVDGCTLVDSRGGENNNSDGFAGSAGSSIRNSLIDTADDGIKIYHDLVIENVTILQHRNGAPIQFGWGGEADHAVANIKGLTIEGVEPDHRYNMAPFTWEGGDAGTREVTIEGLTVKLRGEVYHEATDRWQPAGLFELKPVNCVLNLNVTDAKLEIPSAGLRHTKGSIRINDKVIPMGDQIPLP